MLSKDISVAVSPPRPSGAVEFERVVPTSGNLFAIGRQFWLGPARAGLRVTIWADLDVLHLTIAGARVKTLRSHLSTADLSRLLADGARPAGPPPLPPAEDGAALEVDRAVGRNGMVSLGVPVLAAECLAGRQVSVRIDGSVLQFFDPATRELLRVRPNPLTYDQARRLRGARPAGPPPRPSVEPVRVQRRASNSGIVMVVGQKIALGRAHAHEVVTIAVAEHALTIELGDDVRTIARTTTTAVRSIKCMRPRKVPHVS